MPAITATTAPRVEAYPNWVTGTMSVTLTENRPIVVVSIETRQGFQHNRSASPRGSAALSEAL